MNEEAAACLRTRLVPSSFRATRKFPVAFVLLGMLCLARRM